MMMASVADLLEMLDFVAALEAVIMGEFRPEVRSKVLLSSSRLELRQVEAVVEDGAAVRKGVYNGGFHGAGRGSAGTLLEDGVRKEEEAFEGLCGSRVSGAAGEYPVRGVLWGRL